MMKVFTHSSPGPDLIERLQASQKMMRDANAALSKGDDESLHARGFSERNKALPPKMGLFSPGSLLMDPNYEPDRLLNVVMEKLNLKNDAALCRALEVEPPLISKVRNKKTPIGALLLIRMHEVSKLSIRDLRRSMFKSGD